MLNEFFQTWPLFWQSYMAGWLVAALLSLFGIVVIARGQVFVGVAAAQASALGIAVEIWLVGLIADNHLSQLPALLSLSAVVFAVIAFFLLTPGYRTGHKGAEGATAVLFLFGASSSTLLLSRDPHGTELIDGLATSSIFGATVFDLYTLTCVLVVSSTLFFRFRRTLLLFIVDPTIASTAGIRRRRADLGIALLMGSGLGMSVHATGLVYSFGCLILPALTATTVCRELRQILIFSPVIGLLGSTIGFILANHFDFPPGQLAVLVYCVMLGAAKVLSFARNKQVN